MDDYLQLLILAYFKQYHTYSINDIARLLGTSPQKITDLISDLLQKNYLEYSDDLLRLSPAGRLQIMNHKVDFLVFDSGDLQIPKVHPDRAWTTDRIYIPEGFLSKL